MRTGLRVNFLHWHAQDTVIIVEEGNLPQPRCSLCNMLVPWTSLNGRQPNNAKCTKGMEWKRRRLDAEQMWVITEQALRAYGRPLTSLPSFK